jgi:hypothetical protein
LLKGKSQSFLLSSSVANSRTIYLSKRTAWTLKKQNLLRLQEAGIAQSV